MQEQTHRYPAARADSSAVSSADSSGGASGNASGGSAPAELRDALAYDRNHLANERTFAAWLRTGISVAAGGIAVAHLVPAPARDSWMALLLGAAFVLLGIGVIAYGARQFTRVARELGRDSGRSSHSTAGAVYLLTAIVGILLLAVLLFLWSRGGSGRADDAPDAGGAAGRAESTAMPVPSGGRAATAALPAARTSRSATG